MIRWFIFCLNLTEIGDKQTYNDANKRSLTDRIFSFVDELNALLDKTAVSYEMKWWTTSDKKLSEKVRQIKGKINNIVETNDQLKNELDRQRTRVRRLMEENCSLTRETEEMKLTKMASNEEIIDLRKQVALLKRIAYDGDKSSQGKSTHFL